MGKPASVCLAIIVLAVMVLLNTYFLLWPSGPNEPVDWELGVLCLSGAGLFALLLPVSWGRFIASIPLGLATIAIDLGAIYMSVWGKLSNMGLVLAALVIGFLMTWFFCSFAFGSVSGAYFQSLRSRCSPVLPPSEA